MTFRTCFALASALLILSTSSGRTEDAQGDLELGISLVQKSEFAEAEGILKGALAKTGNTQESVEIQNALGVALIRQRKFEEAEGFFRAALEKCTSEARKAKILSNLASCLCENERPEAALDAYKQAISNSADLTGIERSVLLNGYGNLLRRQKQYLEAKQAYVKTIALREAAHEPLESVLPPLMSLADTELELGQLSECEMVCTKALHVCEESPRNKEFLFAILNNLANVEVLNSHEAQALVHLKQASLLAESLYGRDSPQAETCKATLNEILETIPICE